jgi:hypothetical protein
VKITQVSDTRRYLLTNVPQCTAILVLCSKQ